MSKQRDKNRKNGESEGLRPQHEPYKRPHHEWHNLLLEEYAQEDIEDEDDDRV